MNNNYKLTNYPLKIGRPRKLKRDLEICALLDEGKMTLTEMVGHYKLSRNRLAHIVHDSWKEYIKTKK